MSKVATNRISNGTYRWILCYQTWKADTAAPVITDDGSVPFWESKAALEEASARHGFPLHRIFAVGFNRTSWEKFETNQKSDALTPYSETMEFACAADEIAEGR